MSDLAIAMPIAAVERDTGLSKDVLRVWERRYGFPAPVRDGNGDRLYPPEQVERLHLVKQLLDRGYRPNKVVPLSAAALHGLLQQLTQNSAAAPPSRIVALLKREDPAALGAHLRQGLAAEGLRHFVLGTLAEANLAVGEAWRRGEIAVHDEHLYTEQVQIVLRAALATLPTGSARPRAMLTTLPGEIHTLGLLMVEALLRIEGVEVLPFGPQMPLGEIVAAADKHAIDVVALSFSSSFPAGTAVELIEGLRSQLPAQVEIWCGGRGSPKPARLRELARPVELDAIPEAIAGWRAASGI